MGEFVEFPCSHCRQATRKVPGMKYRYEILCIERLSFFASLRHMVRRCRPCGVDTYFRQVQVNDQGEYGNTMESNEIAYWHDGQARYDVTRGGMVIGDWSRREARGVREPNMKKREDNPKKTPAARRPRGFESKAVTMPDGTRRILPPGPRG